jgi:general nucleoside transport system ATP-binding protein
VTYALELLDIRKRFGAVDALGGATMRVRHGTLHALIGENGAGKTTLMRIAYGLIRQDAGTVTAGGSAVELRSAADAIALGIGMVHQHFTLVPTMTVAENFALGMHGRYDARRAAEQVRQIGRRTGLVLQPERLVRELPVSAQQRLEIVKALARDARLLILDEPTAVLAPTESDELLRWVRRFCDEGKAAILITHKLREARSVADDVTVLRRGATVAAGAANALDEATLVRAMLGEQLAEKAIHSAPPAAGEIVIAADGVWIGGTRGTDALRDASLEVRAGEIVGIAAIEGSGQHELVRVLSQRLVPRRGTVRAPPDVAFIPEDRQRDALVLDMTLTENIALRDLGQRRGRMRWHSIREAAVETLSRFDVRAWGPEAFARELSGGNQQKFVFGREIGVWPRAVVAENPTRGLDIRATIAVHDQLRAVRDAGSAVVVYSSDLDEVLSLADRMVVVHAGIVRGFAGSRDEIGRAMLGAG